MPLLWLNTDHAFNHTLLAFDPYPSRVLSPPDARITDRSESVTNQAAATFQHVLPALAPRAVLLLHPAPVPPRLCARP